MFELAGGQKIIGTRPNHAPFESGLKIVFSPKQICCHFWSNGLKYISLHPHSIKNTMRVLLLTSVFSGLLMFSVYAQSIERIQFSESIQFNSI
jgi:hypothetical protein